MLKDYKDKQLKTAKNKKGKNMEKVFSFFFPEEGKVVKASNLKEAIKKLRKK